MGWGNKSGSWFLYCLVWLLINVMYTKLFFILMNNKSEIDTIISNFSLDAWDYLPAKFSKVYYCDCYGHKSNQ